MSTREKISDIMKKIKPTKNLETNTNIVEGGFVDSFEMMALIAALSDEFGVEITIDEMIPENFNSLDAMAAMVDTLREKR